MVQVFDVFRDRKPSTAPAGAAAFRPDGLKVCGSCTVTHTSACSSAISEITSRVSDQFRQQGGVFDPTDASHLGFLEAQLKPSGLELNRNDKALMAKVIEAAKPAPA